MPLDAGTRLGPYEIVDLLGKGGMGEVYRARDSRLDRVVALKVLPASLSADSDRARRFEQEAVAASRLNHPNVVTIHDIGRQGGTVYIAMELIRGSSLREELSRGPFPVERALRIAGQIAGALATAHAAGIVHRDLKPENVMLSSDGAAKIVDFGLAKLATKPLREADSLASTLDTPATIDGMVLGTLGYMAPEQARGLAADERSDMFSFGAILYEMLTGRRAFEGDGALAVLHAISGPEPVDLGAVPASAPAALAGILRSCLEKDPARRLSSAHDLALRLRELSRAPEDGRRRAGSRRKKAIDSLAVLPLANAGGDSANDYLGDGVTESIIAAISRLPKLQVMASSTTSRYRGRDPREAGRELGVRAVLTGSLSTNADAIRVQAELVDAETGFRLWGESYDRPMSDLAAVQAAIAAEICEHLRFKLSGAERRSIAGRRAQNPEAYQAYLKGRYFWNKWTSEGMRTAIEFYERALEIDPQYAMAWAGIADSYGVLGSMKTVPPPQAFPRAKAAALRALELDPGLADAQASLGYLRWFFDWDWPAAELAFREALRLNPSYATGHRWYGQFLSSMGRHDEALGEVLRALDLDPLSIIIHTAVGDVFFFARRFDDAIGYYRKALEMDREFLAGHSDLARALEFSGRVEEAIGEYEKAIRLAGKSDFDPSIGLANALAVAGRRGEAVGVLEELRRRRTERYISLWGLASISARLGEQENALEWLERAYDEHDSTLVWLKVHPRFDALRTSARFQRLLRQMGLD